MCVVSLREDQAREPMIQGRRDVDINGEQARKKAEILNLLERLVEDVENGRLFGEFSVVFTAQSGNIGHYEEMRRRTFK